MNIPQFMEGFKAAWEHRDPDMFADLFHEESEYHNTPFQCQRGKRQLADYWKRVELQEDVRLSYAVLASEEGSGLAHWHVTYQVASEELFAIWAKSTGTGVPLRQPGDPLPRMVLDGILQARFDAGLCRLARIWWHSTPQAI